MVILGWMGCTPRMLDIYGAIYKRAEITTERLIPTMGSMMLVHQGFRGKGSSLVRETCAMIKERHAKGERVIVHAFSNNGFFFLSACLLHDPSIRDIIVGVIMDSCPGIITADSAATAVSSALRQRPTTQGFRWSLARTVLDPLLRAISERQERTWGVWDDPPLAPTLFLHSDGDEIVSPREVRAFAQLLSARLDAKGAEALSRQDGDGSVEAVLGAGGPGGASGGGVPGVQTRLEAKARRAELSRQDGPGGALPGLRTVSWEDASHCGMLRADRRGYARAVIGFCESVRAGGVAEGVGAALAGGEGR